MALKSIMGGVSSVCRVFVPIRNSASATTLLGPLIWQMSEVNWEIRSKCLACPGEYLSGRPAWA